MRDALARNSDQTLHVVHEAFGVANLTMLDGGYPGLQAITAAEIEAPPRCVEPGLIKDQGSFC
jgi:hypothetical protein